MGSIVVIGNVNEKVKIEDLDLEIFFGEEREIDLDIYEKSSDLKEAIQNNWVRIGSRLGSSVPGTLPVREKLAVTPSYIVDKVAIKSAIKEVLPELTRGSRSDGKQVTNLLKKLLDNQGELKKELKKVKVEAAKVAREAAKKEVDRSVVEIKDEFTPTLKTGGMKASIKFEQKVSEGEKVSESVKELKKQMPKKKETKSEEAKKSKKKPGPKQGKRNK